MPWSVTERRRAAHAGIDREGRRGRSAVRVEQHDRVFERIGLHTAGACGAVRCATGVGKWRALQCCIRGRLSRDKHSC